MAQGSPTPARNGTSEIRRRKTAPSDKNGSTKPKLSVKDLSLESRPSTSKELGSTQPSQRYLHLGVLTILSFCTRLFNIHLPAWVCWDETHFGKMASWYINRTFFFDVHPPLGKMSIGLVGHLTGYNGTFAWDKPGDAFGDTPYVGMRIYCGILGALLVPLTFEIVFSLSKSVRAATIAGALLLFDGSMATLTRYILLDAPLLFFILAAVWSFVKSREHESKIYSVPSILWLSSCGMFLSCAFSVKFVGVFVVFWVGLMVILRLLSLWSDPHTPLTKLLGEFILRAILLILLPIACYIFFFWIHLSVLTKSGPGDGFYTSAFQSSLIGNPLNNATMPAQVAFGATIALKNTKGNGAYLHSHIHLYPTSKASNDSHQQITCYTHKDDNNLWFVRKADTDKFVASPDNVQLLKHGDLVRLEHVVTGKFLHSHRVPAPLTRHHYQVSGFRLNDSAVNEDDIWEVEIEGGARGHPVRTMVSHFRLMHRNTGCALESGTKQLPKWAWEQVEVTCNPRPKKSSYDNELFHVEWVFFPHLPNVTFADHAPSFPSKFVEAHKVMIRGNSGLKPKEGESFSKPWHWPLNLKGQWFSAQEPRVYLLGNPIIWWSNIAVWFIYVGLECFFAIRKMRRLESKTDLKELENRFLVPCRWLTLGFLVHYLPFYGMGRILYYHHYFPAQMFCCMLSGVVLDLCQRLCGVFISGKMLKVILEDRMFYVLLFIACLGFYIFYPLTYGMHGFADMTNSTMHGYRWLNSWEF